MATRDIYIHNMKSYDCIKKVASDSFHSITERIKLTHTNTVMAETTNLDILGDVDYQMHVTM